MRRTLRENTSQAREKRKVKSEETRVRKERRVKREERREKREGEGGSLCWELFENLGCNKLGIIGLHLDFWTNVLLLAELYGVCG